LKRTSVAALALGVLLAAFEAHAQEKGDISVFGGYSPYLFENKAGNKGWNASLEGNVFRHMALVADVSGHTAPASDFSLLFGPRYVHTIRNRVTPFVHFLFGLEHESRQATITGLFSPIIYEPKNSFALGLGAGVDVKVSDRLSVRVIQLDPIIFFNNNFLFGWDGHLRASLGVVLRLNKASNLSFSSQQSF